MNWNRPLRDNQECYDRVKNWLLVQRAVSTNGDRCLYRGPNGLCCAIGALLTDEEYDPSMETISVSSLVFLKRFKKAAIKFQNVDRSFLTRLQSIHDDMLARDWPNKLKSLALKWNLRP